MKNEEARRAAFNRGYQEGDDNIGIAAFTEGWNAHAAHTAALRSAAEALVAKLDEWGAGRGMQELTALKAALEGK